MKEIEEIEKSIKLLARAILEINNTLLKNEKINPYLIKDLENMLWNLMNLKF